MCNEPYFLVFYNSHVTLTDRNQPKYVSGDGFTFKIHDSISKNCMNVQFNFGMSHFPCKHCVTSCFFCLCNNGENRSYLRFRRSIGFSPFSFAWSVCLAPFFHSIDLWAKAQGFLEQPTNTKSTHAETPASTEMSSNHSWRLKKSGKITFLQTALPCTCPVLSELII